MKNKILDFLYDQVQQNKIPQIKKGMVEDLEGFINTLIAEDEAAKMAMRMAERAKQSNDAEMVEGGIVGE